jgi:hypothetical protein
MKLRHTKPCRECPWRKRSAPGWLGGHDPEFYTDAVADNEVPACHLRDFGPFNPKSSMCAGALAVISNSAVDPWKTDGGPEAKARVGRRDDCFGHYRLFYEHHAKKPYVSRIMRKVL